MSDTLGIKVLNALDKAINAPARQPSEPRSIFEPAESPIFTRRDDAGNVVRRQPRYGVTPAIQAMIGESPEVRKALKSNAPEIRETVSQLAKLREGVTEIAKGKNGMDWLRQQEALGQAASTDPQAEPVRTQREYMAACDQRIRAIKLAGKDPTAKLVTLMRPIHEAATAAAHRLFREELEAEQTRAAKFGIGFEGSEILLSIAYAAKQFQTRANVTPEQIGSGNLYPESDLAWLKL